MNDATIAIALFVLYAINDQWAFRCQRVGRGILLLARDTAAGHHGLFTAIMPNRFVNSVWVGRLLWLASIYFAWRVWRWAGVTPIVLYNFYFGVFLDKISPWPSYSTLLQLIKRRITSGDAGFEALLLLPTISDIEKAVASGAHFERVTTGVWIGRAVAAAEAMNQAERDQAAVPQANPPQ